MPDVKRYNMHAKADGCAASLSPNGTWIAAIDYDARITELKHENEQLNLSIDSAHNHTRDALAKAKKLGLQLNETQKALAASLLSEAHCRHVEIASIDSDERQLHRAEKAEAERDIALERVKELEAWRSEPPDSEGWWGDLRENGMGEVGFYSKRSDEDSQIVRTNNNREHSAQRVYCKLPTPAPEVSDE